MKTFRLTISALIISMGIIQTSCTKNANIELPAIFSENMVLQQNILATIWGKALPGSTIQVAGTWGEQETTKTGDDGKWQVTLSTPSAGGPYNLTISGKNSLIEIENVLIGEVWLASGQSNMEMPLTGWPPHDPILDSEETIASANYPEIRMFTVQRNTSAIPLDDVSGQWQIATPENAGGFSATAYFFARKIHVETGFPVGVIHSSWGGTPAESWISGKMLSIDKDFSEAIEKLEQAEPQEMRYMSWLSSHKSIEIGLTPNNEDPLVGLDAFDTYGSNPDLNASEWGSITIPTFIEQTEIGDFDGIIWFRREIDIPSNWEGRNLVLSLGPIDDRDVTYFNGIRIGGMEEAGHYQTERNYTVPSELVKAGKATLAVKMTDTQGGGGIYGQPHLLTVYPEQMDEEAISLAGIWKYKVVAELKGNNLYLFDPEKVDLSERPVRDIVVGSHTPSALYNAMIAPLIPYNIKGVIWYQGESNVGRANQYMRLKSMLTTDWRNNFSNNDMAFYFVQLAPWHNNNLTGISSANLREAQRRMSTNPNTGMAVTLDIGDVNNIHPANKLDVGERLARIALSNNYNFDIPFSGPEPAEKRIENGRIVLSFKHATGGLIIKDTIPEQFEIAGADGIFYPAKVEVRDDSIILNSEKVPNPENVRYAYRNNSIASLFNNAGLPAASFTTENEIVD
jgi:sialate O-acetylesterase